MAKQSQPARRIKSPDRPWKPVVVTGQEAVRGLPGILHPSDVSALFAVSQGVANEDQQKRAIGAIHKIAVTGDMSYRPDDLGGDRDTAFAEGKRYVGLQMAKLITHHAAYIKD